MQSIKLKTNSHIAHTEKKNINNREEKMPSIAFTEYSMSVRRVTVCSLKLKDLVLSQ